MLENEIWAYALKNSIEHGKADPGRILPKLFNHGLKKEQIREILPSIIKIVNQANRLSNEEKINLLEKYKKYEIEHEEKPHGLPELQNPSSKMLFRLAPFPSGALHIGNAKTYLLNALYAEKYNARTLLIMDDTIGSEEKPIEKEGYKLIEDGFSWLKVEYEKPIIYKSDRLDIYYKYAIELIEKDKAYVCHCPQEVLRKKRAEGIECEHRNRSIKEQLKEWKEIFKAKESSTVLRIKTDMQHPNPAFRDRVLFKIADRAHPRTKKKYRVWPTLEMSWAIDDHLLGITHIIRGNDLMIESDMEKYIWDIFSWKHPEITHTGLIKIEGIEGAKLSKSKSQKEVKSGEFSGWDDPRTWSIQSLSRRGFKEESIREFVKEIGLNKQDITVPIESLYAINRKLIDKEANRFSFVESPVELNIKNAPKIKEIEINIHPDKKEKRKLKINDINISKKDFDNLKGNEIRLLHLYNIKLDKSGKNIEFTSTENKDIQKINWVSNGIKTKIIMPDGKWVSGLADPGISKLKPNDLIQFERFGFCRLDKKSKTSYEFWFAHK